MRLAKSTYTVVTRDSREITYAAKWPIQRDIRS
jgi:hypothetical protein